MDLDQRVKLVIGGAVVLLILVVIAAVVFFGRFTQTEQAEQSTLDSLSSLQSTPSTPVTPQPQEPATTGSGKQYVGTNFSLRYSNNWGLLTCNNSTHFEFDPVNTTDNKISCDRAVKPITVLVVSGLNCQGDLVVLNGKQVLKSKTTDSNGDIDYRWCLNASGDTSLDITHRVSKSGGPAFSKEDYSAQIEEMIKTVTSTPQGS